jgi:hypothetical protein
VGSGTGQVCCDASRCLITLASQRRVSGWMDGWGLTQHSSRACIADTTPIPFLHLRQNCRRMRRDWVCCMRRRSSAGVSGALAMRLPAPATDPRDTHGCLGRYDLCRTAGRSDIGSVRGRERGKMGVSNGHRWEPSPSPDRGCLIPLLHVNVEKFLQFDPTLRLLSLVPTQNVLYPNRTIDSHDMGGRECY